MSCEAHILPLPIALGLPGASSGRTPVPFAAEVTDVRVDAAQSGRACGSVWRATGHEEPVFLDHSGRRKHLMAVLATVAATLSVGWLGALFTGAAGFADLPAGTLAVASAPRPAAVISHTAERARLSSALALPLAHRRTLADLDDHGGHHRRVSQRLTRA